MSRNLFVTVAALVLLGVTAGCDKTSSAERSAGTPGKTSQKIELLNVSYDPTRELWRALNEQFVADYANTPAGAGIDLTITQSHGGSSSQARSVIDGLEADVVTLALWGDTDAIRKVGLISDGWEKRLPHDSIPYFSTIVFVVRKGNPKKIKDWSDLVGDGVEVITPSPKTSGNGKLSFLAAWASVVKRGGSEKDAEEFLKKLYQHAPVLDSGARGSTTTFAQKKIGDVHLTWENEAHLEVKEAGDELEIVYPPISIRAEPPVAWVDANVKRKGTEAITKAYLEFVYTPAGQEILAANYYRPVEESVLAKHHDQFPDIKLVGVTEIAKGWADTQERFFKEGALFDKIYQQRGK
jgi:sulfate/thiosulfate-binding protein